MCQKLYVICNNIRYSFYKEHQSYYLKPIEDGIMHIQFKSDGEINLDGYKQIIKEIGAI